MAGAELAQEASPEPRSQRRNSLKGPTDLRSNGQAV